MSEVARYNGRTSFPKNQSKTVSCLPMTTTRRDFIAGSAAIVAALSGCLSARRERHRLRGRAVARRNCRRAARRLSGECNQPRHRYRSARAVEISADRPLSGGTGGDRPAHCDTARAIACDRCRRPSTRRRASTSMSCARHMRRRPRDSTFRTATWPCSTRTGRGGTHRTSLRRTPVPSSRFRACSTSSTR